MLQKNLRSCYCTLISTSIVMLLNLLLFPIHFALSDTLRIGVFSPSSGKNQSMGNQIIAGAKIAAEETKNINAKIVYLEWDGENFRKALLNLKRKKPTFVIVGIGGQNLGHFVDELKKPSNISGKTPYIFLARNHTPQSIGSLKKFSNVLNFGYTFYDFHRLSLDTWSKQYKVERPMVLYADGQNYVRQKNLLKAALIDKKVQSLPLANFVGFSKGHNYPDGVILAGHPSEMAMAASQIKRNNIDLPVYISGKYGGPNLGFVRSIKLPKVTYSTMWISGNSAEENLTVSNFSSKVNEMLGWQSYAFSSFAIDAYEATKVGFTAWRKWKEVGLKNSTNNPWEFLKTSNPISGLAGDKIQYWEAVKGMINSGYLVESSEPKSYRFSIPQK